MNANARSLSPKIESLADCMHEIDADVAIITETWLQNSAVSDTAIDMAAEHGLSLFTLNRQVIAANGRQYGGVAISTRSSRTTFKKVEIANPENFEVLCIAGKIQGINEKIVVYLPPNYPKPRADACLDYIADTISEAKRMFQSPMIIVAGDWNQWPTDYIRQEHTDLSEVEHGPTRGGNKIDRFLVNFGRAVIEADTLHPLDDGLGRESDHLAAYFKAAISKPKLPVTKYRYMNYTDEGAVKFQQWIQTHSFKGVYAEGEVNRQLEVFLAQLEASMDVCFPYKTTVRREGDPPWINSYIRTMIKKRRKVWSTGSIKSELCCSRTP